MSTTTQATFPNYAPTQRDFTDAQYPVKTFTTIGGVEYRRLYSNVPYNYQLKLSYTLKNFKAFEFRNHYRNQQGTFRTFTIPSDYLTWAGLGPQGAAIDLSTDSATGAPIQWRYAEPPTFTPLPGANRYTTVAVSLVGVVQTRFNQ